MAGISESGVVTETARNQLGGDSVHLSVAGYSELGRNVAAAIQNQLCQPGPAPRATRRLEVEISEIRPSRQPEKKRIVEFRD